MEASSTPPPPPASPPDRGVRVCCSSITTSFLHLHSLDSRDYVVVRVMYNNISMTYDLRPIRNVDTTSFICHVFNVIQMPFSGYWTSNKYTVYIM